MIHKGRWHRPHNPMPESRYEVLALFTGAMVASSIFLMSTGTLAPFIESSLHITQAQIGGVLSIQLVGSILMTAVCGMLTDRFGDKRVVFWSGLFMGAALLVASLVKDYNWMMIWLLIYGLGFAAVTPAGSHAIIFFFKKEDRGLAMGVRQCGVPIAGVLGSILLPAIAARLDYQWALAGAGVLTIVACTLASLLYREPRELEGEPVAMVEMLRQMAGIARDTRLILLTIVSMLLVCSQLGVMGFLTLTLVHQAQMRIDLAVGMFTISQAAAIGGRLSWGWVSDHVFKGKRALPLAVCAVLTALSLFALATVDPQTPLWLVALVCAATGFTSEGWLGVAVIAAAEIGGEEHSGSALGVSLTGLWIAAFFAPTLLGVFVQVQGYPAAWRGLAILTLLAVIPAMLASTAMTRFVEAKS